MTSPISSNYQQITECLDQGGVIAYPTESVWGLGCDPDNQQAVQKILSLKQRDINKGLILIAANYSQLLPYISDKQIPQDKRFSVLSKWPGPVTLLLPANPKTPEYLTGQFDTLAVRVTDHQGVCDLCNTFGKPLVSTSANPSGEDAAATIEQVQAYFNGQVDMIVDGKTSGRDKPSQIINPLSGEIFRV